MRLKSPILSTFSIIGGSSNVPVFVGNFVSRCTSVPYAQLAVLVCKALQQGSEEAWGPQEG